MLAYVYEQLLQSLVITVLFLPPSRPPSTNYAQTREKYLPKRKARERREHVWLVTPVSMHPHLLGTTNKNNWLSDEECKECPMLHNLTNQIEERMSGLKPLNVMK